MAAHVISEVEVLDEELAKQYRPLAASIAEYDRRLMLVEAPPPGSST